MFKLSQRQIQSFEMAQGQGNLRIITAELERTPDGPATGLHQLAQHIAAFCNEHQIHRGENVRRIAQAHARRGLDLPAPHMAAPLRRSGFSETERVDAYVRALEGQKERHLLGGAG